MYVRRVQGETLDFGHRGWLLDESFIFYDRQSDSLWVQATGKCVRGKYRGQQLDTLPVTHTTWANWRSLHPDTVVLAKPPDRVNGYRHDHYAEYYRRFGKTFGLAVFVGSDQKLYPLSELERDPLVYDRIGGRAVMVVYHAPSGTAVALDPTTESAKSPTEFGERRFELEEVLPNDVLLRETSTQIIWSGLAGRAQAATPHPPLPQLRTTQFVVDNWLKHFPESPIYRREERDRRGSHETGDRAPEKTAE